MTLVIAHRGASGYRPEMTIPSYELALEQELKSLEINFLIYFLLEQALLLNSQFVAAF